MSKVVVHLRPNSSNVVFKSISRLGKVTKENRDNGTFVLECKESVISEIEKFEEVEKVVSLDKGKENPNYAEVRPGVERWTNNLLVSPEAMQDLRDWGNEEQKEEKEEKEEEERPNVVSDLVRHLEEAEKEEPKEVKTRKPRASKKQPDSTPGTVADEFGRTRPDVDNDQKPDDEKPDPLPTDTDAPSEPVKDE